VGPYLAIMLGMLFLITYVPWISLVLTRFVE
jgi:TRAP-type C4-dicarboxylate transport system permease large subunit